MGNVNAIQLRDDFGQVINIIVVFVQQTIFANVNRQILYSFFSLKTSLRYIKRPDVINIIEQLKIIVKHVLIARKAKLIYFHGEITVMKMNC